MAWPSVRYKTAAAAGTWSPADHNALQDQFVRADGLVESDFSTDIKDRLGLESTRHGYNMENPGVYLNSFAVSGNYAPVTVTVPANGLYLVRASVDLSTPAGQQIHMFLRDSVHGDGRIASMFSAPGGSQTLHNGNGNTSNGGDGEGGYTSFFPSAAAHTVSIGFHTNGTGNTYIGTIRLWVKVLQFA